MGGSQNTQRELNVEQSNKQGGPFLARLYFCEYGIINYRQETQTLKTLKKEVGAYVHSEKGRQDKDTSVSRHPARMCIIRSSIFPLVNIMPSFFVRYDV